MLSSISIAVLALTVGKITYDEDFSSQCLDQHNPEAQQYTLEKQKMKQLAAFLRLKSLNQQQTCESGSMKIN